MSLDCGVCGVATGHYWWFLRWATVYLAGWKKGVVATGFRFVGRTYFVLRGGGSTVVFSPCLSSGPRKLATGSVGISCVFIDRNRFSRLNDTFRVTGGYSTAVVSATRVYNLTRSTNYGTRTVRLNNAFGFPFNGMHLALTFRNDNIPNNRTYNVIVSFCNAGLCFTNSATLFDSVRLLPGLSTFRCTILPVNNGFAVSPGSTLVTYGLLRTGCIVPMRCGA